MAFTDTEFMTAKEKELVLKDFTRFIQALIGDSGKQETDKYGNEMPVLFKKFTKRLYEHLYLHCGFIAHYDSWGFFRTYFQAGTDTETFFNNLFDVPFYRQNDDYSDLLSEMNKVYQENKNAIFNGIEKDIEDKLNILEMGIRHSRGDREYAKKFLSSLNL